MPSWQMIKIGLILFGVVIASAAAARVQYKIDLSERQKLELDYKNKEADAKEQARQEQIKIDKVGSDADAAELKTQRELLAQAQIRLGQVTKHVPAGKSNCITWGLIRVIDASVLRLDPDALPLPAGKTDASCASRKAADLASSIVGNYSMDQRNIEHGQALQTYLQQLSQVKR